MANNYNWGGGGGCDAFFFQIIFLILMYRYCEKCERYVSESNVHCELCNDCTSKVMVSLIYMYH